MELNGIYCYGCIAPTITSCITIMCHLLRQRVQERDSYRVKGTMDTVMHVLKLNFQWDIQVEMFSKQLDI